MKLFVKFNTDLSEFFTRKAFLALSCLIFLIFSNITNSYASGNDYGLGRTRTCNANGDVEGMHFSYSNGGRDAEFVMTNPVCISVVATSYSAVKIAIAYMNSVCGSGDTMPRIIPSPLLDAIDISRATMAIPGNPNCGGAVLVAAAAFQTAIAMMYSIYSISDHVFDNSEICGSKWVGPNAVRFNNSNPTYKAEVQDMVESFINDPLLNGNLNFDNKYYREWYYNGVEIDDNPADGNFCPDVSKEKVQHTLGLGNSVYIYPPQKYYLRGLETGNFNCKKYDLYPGQLDPRDGSPLTQERLQEYRNAFECCKKRSEKYICIKYMGQKKFCRAGSRCEINGIFFEAIPRDNGRLICAQTYSLCPYNFYIGGGAETCDYFQDGIYSESQGHYVMITQEDIENGLCASKSEIRNSDCTYNNKAGKCKNYCQYLKHCTVTNSIYQYKSQINSAYFSNACLNFAGDSQNQTSYGTGFIAGSARHFSAPIAQCVKETLENVFFNRAGHTRCLLESDSANSNNVCENGESYHTGDQVAAESFFSRLQRILNAAIKMILTLSIVAYGIKVLLGSGQIKKPELFMYIIKLGLVMFFALGGAWQTMFFDGVYSASTVFAQIVFKMKVSDEITKRDGCQFGNITDLQGNSVSISTYPYGKEYLAIWDTVDCKIARYLGFGPEVSKSNITLLILAGYLTGAPGIYFAISLLIFGLVLISAIIRALHIFLSSSIAILILVYVSPIMIAATLFNKTQSLFKGWVTQLMSFCLQPMILFAYIAIFLSIMDETLIGSATFYGPAPNRTIKCSDYCTDASDNPVSMEESLGCSRDGDNLHIPSADSFACIIDFNTYDNWPGLELIGISIPFILEFFTEHPKEKILTILKGALILFLLYKFIDEIPRVASQLIGGVTLGQSTIGADKMFGATAGFMRGFQKRANRAGIKGLKKAGKGASKRARDAANKFGNDGKSVDMNGGPNSKDEASSSSQSSDGAASQGGNTNSAGQSNSNSDSSGSDTK